LFVSGIFVKQRDDLASAMRYAIMMRRSGKPLSECDGIGSLPYARQQSQRSDENDLRAEWRTIPTVISMFSRGDDLRETRLAC
jgi:hypothetical protein